MAQRSPVTEIYWEAVYADDPENQNQNQSQSQSQQNETETDEIEMKIYEDVGNTEEAQELREDIKSEKRKNKTL
jgi:hypothetical protein